MRGSKTYLMDNLEEEIRLEIKTDPNAVCQEAAWCDLKPGVRVLAIHSVRKQPDVLTHTISTGFFANTY
jgi:hypothetical protein